MPSWHPVNSTIEGIKFVDQVLFSFFSVNFFWCFHLFKNCYSHVFQAMSRFVEMDSSSFSRKYTWNVSFMFWKACWKASFSLSNVSLATILFVAFNHIDTIFRIAIHWCHYSPYCIVIHLNFFPFKNVWTSLTRFVTFAHSIHFSFGSVVVVV